MRQSRLPVVVFAFAAGFVGTSGARQDQPLVLKGDDSHPKVNQQVTQTTTFKIANADVTVKAAGATAKLTQTVTAVLTEKVKYLAVDAKTRQVTKAQTTVTAQTVTTDTTPEGKSVTSVPTVSGLQGKDITSTRLLSGKWEHTLSPAATADQKKELDRRPGPENDDDLFPTDPALAPGNKVSVGTEWKVEAAKFERLFGGSVTSLKGTLTLSRESDAKEAGEDCAVIAMRGTVTGVTAVDGGQLTVEMEMTGKTWRTVTTKFDVKDDVAGTIAMSGTLSKDGRDFEFKMKGPFTLVRTAKLTGP